MFDQAYASLLNQLEEMPLFLKQSVARLPLEVLRRQPAEDKSPLLEHLWHVRDCDADLYGLRIRRVLNEARPHLVPVDVGVWPEQRQYASRSGDVAVSEFADLRADLVKVLRNLGQDDVARVGIRADGSEINVIGLIEQMADHDRDHRWRMAAILKGFGPV